jgi:hypothetical protein
MSTDPNNGSRTVAALLIDGGTIDLQKLTPSDFVALANFIAAPRREKLEANAKAAGYTGKELFERLNEFDSRPITRAEIIDAVKLPDVQAEVFRRSVARTQAKDATLDDVDALGLDMDEGYRLALSLLHIPVRVTTPTTPTAPTGGAPPLPVAAPSPPSPGSEIPSLISSPTPTESELVST